MREANFSSELLPVPANIECVAVGGFTETQICQQSSGCRAYVQNFHKCAASPNLPRKMSHECKRMRRLLVQAIEKG